MLGDNVSLSQAFIVTVFSMLIVFATLYIISLILGGFKSLFYKDNEKQKPKGNIKLEEKQKVIKEEIKEDVEEMEIIAAITVALAESLSVSPADIKIKTIKRIAQTPPVWALAGRQKQLTNKL